MLLTDVVMPQRNGRELYARLAGRRPQLRVLYMSGYTEDVIIRRGVLEQGTSFISKPFTAKDLLEGESPYATTQDAGPSWRGAE